MRHSSFVISLLLAPLLLVVVLFAQPAHADHCVFEGNLPQYEACLETHNDGRSTGGFGENANGLPEQEFGPQPSGQLGTGQVDVSDNPIYKRLIEIVNFLSVGVGIVASISVAYAGIQYLMSRGNPSATAAAISRIIHAAIAIFLYVFGWAILNWLIPGGIF